MHETGLSRDVLRLIVARLSLWDARSLQLAHPEFAALVHEHVARMVEAVRTTPRPSELDTFLKTRPGFQERSYEEFVFLRTPKDLIVHACHDGVTVLLHKAEECARIEVRMPPVTQRMRPGFDTLRHTLQSMWWFAAAASGNVHIRTRATTHHPPSEVLNTLAGTFAKRHIEPLFVTRTTTRTHARFVSTQTM